MFIISGYFISDKTSIKEYIFNKAKRLIIPYVVCCSIIILEKSLVGMIKGQSGLAVKNMEKWLWVSLFGSGNGHGSWIFGIGTNDEIGMLWFLLALFWGSIIIRLIYTIKYRIGLAIGISLVGLVTSRFIWLPFSIQQGMAVVFWIYMGVYIRQKEALHTISDIICSYKVGIIILIWGISAIFGCTHLYENYYGLGIFDVLGAMCGCILVYGGVLWLQKYSVKFKLILSWLGRNTMWIYTVHFLIEKSNILSFIIKRYIVLSDITIVLLRFIVEVFAAYIVTMIAHKFLKKN
jgi:fucose 4-O-acetylase-like acetyltransferase